MFNYLLLSGLLYALMRHMNVYLFFQPSFMHWNIQHLQRSNFHTISVSHSGNFSQIKTSYPTVELKFNKDTQSTTEQKDEIAAFQGTRILFEIPRYWILAFVNSWNRSSFIRFENLWAQFLKTTDNRLIQLRHIEEKIMILPVQCLHSFPIIWLERTLCTIW